MNIIATTLQDCYLLQHTPFDDARGRLLKPFHKSTFTAAGLCDTYGEDLVVTSAQGVLRGLHFQHAPHAQVKVVTCVHGRIFDAVVDLRSDSPTFRQWQGFELWGDGDCSLYVPAGFAHGYYVYEDQTVVFYKCSALYSPEYDGGIRWDSAGVEWPDASPTVSDKDRMLPDLEAYLSARL